MLSIKSLRKMDAILDLKNNRLVMRKIKVSGTFMRNSAGHLLLPVASTSKGKLMATLVMAPAPSSWLEHTLRGKQGTASQSNTQGRSYGVSLPSETRAHQDSGMEYQMYEKSFTMRYGDKAGCHPDIHTSLAGRFRPAAPWGGKIGWPRMRPRLRTPWWRSIRMGMGPSRI